MGKSHVALTHLACRCCGGHVEGSETILLATKYERTSSGMSYIIEY